MVDGLGEASRRLLLAILVENVDLHRPLFHGEALIDGWLVDIVLLRNNLDLALDNHRVRLDELAILVGSRVVVFGFENDIVTARWLGFNWVDAEH